MSLGLLVVLMSAATVVAVGVVVLGRLTTGWGLVGLLAGATLTLAGQWAQTSHDDERADKQAAKEVKGVARIMQIEYRLRTDDLLSTIDRERFPTKQADLSLASSLSIADRALVLRSLSGVAADDVFTAEGRLARAQRLLDRYPGVHLAKGSARAFVDLCHTKDLFQVAARRLTTAAATRPPQFDPGIMKRAAAHCARALQLSKRTRSG